MMVVVVVVIVIAVALGLILRRLNYGASKNLFPRVRVGLTHKLRVCFWLFCLLGQDLCFQNYSSYLHITAATTFLLTKMFLFIHLVFIQVERVRMDQADSPPFTAQFVCGVRKSKNSNPRYVSTEVLRSHHPDKQPKILIVIIPGLHASACSRIHMSVGLDCLESATTVASS